jgi:hypothetical protein
LESISLIYEIPLCVQHYEIASENQETIRNKLTTTKFIL